MKRVLQTLAGEHAGPLAAAYAEAARAKNLAPDADAVSVAALLSFAYPALRAQVISRPEDVIAISRGKLRIARDLRAYRRLAVSFVSDLAVHAAVKKGLRLFAQRERLRIAARELLASEGGGDVDTTARELSDLAQACIEIAVAEALTWAESRFGKPVNPKGERVGLTVLGMGKLGGRELNCGSDVDLLPFYETDEGQVERDGRPTEQSLHEHFTRVTQRFTGTLEENTDEGHVWRVDLRLRPEGSRGPLVNAVAAAERYYETWGRTWERAALLRARAVAGDLSLGEHILERLAPFVWRKNVDPRIAREMTDLVVRGRTELATEPERDLKLGPGGIREAEFFTQSLQLIWGGREPQVRHPNTLEALRRLRARGLVTDREDREMAAAYMVLRRLEHRVQYATGIQTHVLPRGELLETIARTLGYASGRELEKDLDRTRRKVGAKFASLTKNLDPAPAERLAPLLAALDADAEDAVLTALSDPKVGLDASAVSADLARHVLTLARRPDFPLGAAMRDKYPGLAPELIEALADAADPEQAARLLAQFFARLATPSVYARAMAEDRQVLRKLVGLLGASAFLGEALVFHPELVESVLFTKGVPNPELARSGLAEELLESASQAASTDIDPEDAFVGGLRRAKSRVMMEVGLAELSGELSTREAAFVLSSIAEATLEAATARALSEKGLDRGLSVVSMGKLGGREIGYGSDLDIFFVYNAPKGDDDQIAEKYVRAAQRVLRLVSTPHGDGPGYELDTRLRPSGSQGLLVVSLEAFARYHGLAESGESLPVPPEGRDWERQALLRARPCAGDVELGRRVLAIATKVAYEKGPPDAGALHHLRMRMENELGRERSGSGPARYDVKVGHGGIVDVEFAVQWLQMKYGRDPRVRTADTETALTALETCGYLETHLASVLREGYAMLRRLEQALRVVHGTSISLIEEGAEGLPALARRMGFRESAKVMAGEALLARYRAVTRDVRSAYVTVLELKATSETTKEPS